MEFLTNPETYISLLTLTFLEIVLGIDNIIFISIITGKLPAEKQASIRTLGLILALFFRIGLLSIIAWIIKLTQPLFSVGHFEFSWRDLILLAGGLFLLAKSVTEIHHKMEGEHEEQVKPKAISPLKIIIQIVVLDIVFSFDSILTAIGLSDQLPVMIMAIVIAIIVMIYFSGYISDFINRFPTFQVLALSFLILIGFMLAIEAFHYEIPKGYIYFALFFSFCIEIINIKVSKSSSSSKAK